MFSSTFFVYFQQFDIKTSKSLAFYQPKTDMSKQNVRKHKPNLIDKKSSYNDYIVGTLVNCAMDYSCTPKILYALPAR